MPLTVIKVFSNTRIYALAITRQALLAVPIARSVYGSSIKLARSKFQVEKDLTFL